MDTKSAGFSLLSKSMQQRILAEQGEQPQAQPEAKPEAKPESEMSDAEYWAKVYAEDDGYEVNEVRMRAGDFPRRRRGLNW